MNLPVSQNADIERIAVAWRKAVPGVGLEEKASSCQIA